MIVEFSPRIWVSIRSYARDEDHADDLLQDCWMAILNQLDQFKRNDSFASWTIKVSRNVCFDRLRGKGAKAKEVSLDSISGLAAEGPDPLEELGRRRARPIVYTALSRLSDRERDAMVLWVLMERSLTETATALGVTEPGTRTILARAMSRLRRMPAMKTLLMEWMGE